jgi:hypothetical protein
MPFIVTTKRPYKRAEVQVLRARGEHGPIANMRIVSRRAVATLEEARSVCRGTVHETHVNGAPVDEPWVQTDALRESGGTVGPLPDGTVIKVEPQADDFDVATFNAREAT